MEYREDILTTAEGGYLKYREPAIMETVPGVGGKAR